MNGIYGWSMITISKKCSIGNFSMRIIKENTGYEIILDDGAV
jgi:hypothetical protein